MVIDVLADTLMNLILIILTNSAILLKRINEEKWDSLIHVNLIIGIESELDIKFNSAQIESLNSFKSILNIIKKNINEKNS